MKDRIPTHPGRVKLNPVTGQTNTFDMEMADGAVEEGTPPIKRHLLPDQVAQNIDPISPPADVGEALDKLAAMIYPIGSIYMSVNNVNPSALFGGTWERYAEGRTLIGVTGNATSQIQSGSATVQLPNHLHSDAHTHTISNHVHSDAHTHNISNHLHSMAHNHSMGAHSHTITNAAGAHIASGHVGSTLFTRMTQVYMASWAGAAARTSGSTGDGSIVSDVGAQLRGSTGAMSTTPNTGASSATNTGNPTSNPASGARSVVNTGNPTTNPASGARNVVNTGNPTTQPTISTIQPSITCFIWRRTA